MSEKTYTMEELKGLTGKKDIHLLIHGKVYAIAPFLDEHPGGDEVLFGEAGRDATEAFEDVGHSDEAREILKKYLVGECPEGAPKGPGNAKQSRAVAEQKETAGNLSYLFPLAGIVGYFAYKYYQQNYA